MPKSNEKSRKKGQKVYMDYASSAISRVSNPGAIHEYGLKEKNKLESARVAIASFLSSQASEVVFTSGATESNNLAILGLVRGFKNPHIITTNIEHASVLEVCKFLEKSKQAEVTYVPVEAGGVVDVEKIKKALKQNTVLVSVMYANNEIGTIEPIREIAKQIRHWNKNMNKEVFFHTDATQAVNYLPINIEKLGVDMMSFNGAKIYGPKGVGVLYVKKGTPLTPVMFGGDQEFGLRPGTENVEAVVDLAKALKDVENIKDKEVVRLIKLRNYFIAKLQKMSKTVFDTDLVVNGDLENRLPNNVNITIPKIPSDLLVIELSANGVMASAKSACKAGDGKASYVIQAINPNTKEEDGSLRFSLGRNTTKAEVDYAVKSLAEILNKLKKWYY